MTIFTTIGIIALILFLATAFVFSIKKGFADIAKFFEEA